MHRNLSKTYASTSLRFDISHELRNVLPHLQADPTEEDVVLGVWEYINSRGLLEGKEGNSIRCDEALEAVLGAQMLPVSLLRSRLSSHMMPPRPIQIDYILSQGSPRGSGKEGKSFEIEVDLHDPFCARLLQQSNIASSEQAEYQEAAMQSLARASHIAMSIARQKAKIDLLRSIAAAPMCSVAPTSLSNVVVAVGSEIASGLGYAEIAFSLPQLATRATDAVSLLEGRSPTQPLGLDPLRDDFSAIRPVNDAYTVNSSLRGYIDVGDDKLFRSRGADWADSARRLEEHVRASEIAAASSALAAAEKKKEAAEGKAGEAASELAPV